MVSMTAADMDQAVSALKDMKMQQLAFVSTGWVVMERAKAAKQSKVTVAQSLLAPAPAQARDAAMSSFGFLDDD